MDWQSIETAPDEELIYVLGFHANGEPWWNIGSRYGDAWDCGSSLTPTHWMPLPEPPAA